MHVGVIGGGITGLALVHELHERDIEVTCFEGSASPGGVIQTSHLDGLPVEHGPQRMRLSGIVESYLEQFDLTDELVIADSDLPIYVYFDGRLREVPFDLMTGLRTDALSLRGKLRLLKEPLVHACQPDETAASYFSRKLGDEAYRNLIEPLFGGLYASDPARMPARHALEPLLRLERSRGSLMRIAIRRLRVGDDRPPAVVPEAGMQALPDAIAEMYADSVELGTPVGRIEADGGQYVIHAAGETRVFDRVVLATDAHAAAQLLNEMDGPTSSALADLTYNPLVMVYLKASIDHRGLGFQVRRDEPYETLGVSWNGIAFGRDHLHTVFLGGMHRPGLTERTDGALCSLATQEFNELMGVEATCLGVHRVTPGMPAYDFTWDGLDEIDLPPGIDLIGSYTARVGIPGRLRQARELADRLDSSS